MKPKRPYPLTAIYAEDWSCYDSKDEDEDSEFALIPAWICGLIIREDDKVVMVCPFYFPDSTSTRNVMVISKHSIIYRRDYK